MPFSISTLRCRLDPDLDAALFDYQERLGNQLTTARAQLAVISSLGASVMSDFAAPLRSSLDAILASAGTSTEGLIDATSLVDGDSSSDIEAAIGDRFRITIVGGRLILPGTRDLSAIQLFHVCWVVSRRFSGFFLTCLLSQLRMIQTLGRIRLPWRSHRGLFWLQHICVDP